MCYYLYPALLLAVSLENFVYLCASFCEIFQQLDRGVGNLNGWQPWDGGSINIPDGSKLSFSTKLCGCSYCTSEVDFNVHGCMEYGNSAYERALLGLDVALS